MTTPPAPPQREGKSWFWTALVMAGAILLCCGLGPFVIVTAIELVRHSSSGGADKNGAAASASHPPTPGVGSPRASPQATPSPSPSPNPSPSPSPSPSPNPSLPSPPSAPRPPLALSPGQPQIPLPQAPVPRPPVPPSNARPPAQPQQPPVITPPPHADGHMGESVRDGQLEFVVRSVQCGLKMIGADPRSVKAKGQFCVVTIAVHNIDDRPQTLFEMEQKAIGDNGTEYSSHSIASLLANEPDNTTWLSEIKPGGETAGAIVYDLPKGIDLARLVLNDPTVPGGVNIVLR